MQRRSVLGLGAGASLMSLAARVAAVPVDEPAAGPITWRVTTQNDRWRAYPPPSLSAPKRSMMQTEVNVAVGRPGQLIEGFGAAFSELGWLALQRLPAEQRSVALDALFGSELALTLGRTPIGANDFSRGWYSYDETPGDFELRRFTVANDRKTLIPFIKAAQGVRPDLRLWASPWSPPTWMKRNGFYASAPSWPGTQPNGIRPDQIAPEGADAFILEPRYLDAYARYFRRYVEEYGREQIRIGMVMPQNEFNSPQPFPSCPWTPEGLAKFIPHLGSEMSKVGVDIMFGTLERPNAELLDRVLADPQAGPLIKGVGVQWGGKGALEDIRKRHPDLPIWGSEQECGRGTNDWHYARYSWQRMKQYFNAGASAWHYWNMALTEQRASTWGWPQNSLLVVDTHAGTFTRTNDFWILRHLSAFVRPGARFIPADSYVGYEDQLAFQNPDGSLVIVAQNGLADPLPMTFAIGAKQLSVTLPPDSFSTIVIEGALMRQASSSD